MSAQLRAPANEKTVNGLYSVHMPVSDLCFVFQNGHEPVSRAWDEKPVSALGAAGSYASSWMWTPGEPSTSLMHAS